MDQINKYECECSLLYYGDNCEKSKNTDEFSKRSFHVNTMQSKR